MRRSFLELLVDPVHHGPLVLEAGDGVGDVIDGILRAIDGRAYPIRGGLPRFVVTEDEGQLQTLDAFSFKWSREESYSWMRRTGSSAPYESWLWEKYGFKSDQEWREHYCSCRQILDLGCGAGMASWSWLTSDRWDGSAAWVGLDISRAVEVAAANLSSIPGTHFVQGDALQLPFPSSCFDAILSEGVLHHTPSTRSAILAASRVLSTGGEFGFYVYRRKGPVREFTDDHVRDQIANLSNEEAWGAMRPLTKLGRSLARLQSEVEVEEDVPLLGIKAGRQDVQRLIYWNFAKLFWNEQLDFEENVHINFDWYRPRYAHRQSVAEVQSWCTEAGLEIRHLHEEDSGITVRAVKM